MVQQQEQTSDRPAQAPADTPIDLKEYQARADLIDSAVTIAMLPQELKQAVYDIVGREQSGGILHADDPDVQAMESELTKKALTDKAGAASEALEILKHLDNNSPVYNELWRTAEQNVEALKAEGKSVEALEVLTKTVAPDGGKPSIVEVFAKLIKMNDDDLEHLDVPTKNIIVSVLKDDAKKNGVDFDEDSARQDLFAVAPGNERPLPVLSSALPPEQLKHNLTNYLEQLDKVAKVQFAAAADSLATVLSGSAIKEPGTVKALWSRLADAITSINLETPDNSGKTSEQITKDHTAVEKDIAMLWNSLAKDDDVDRKMLQTLALESGIALDKDGAPAIKALETPAADTSEARSK